MSGRAQRGLKKVAPLNDVTVEVKRWAFDARPAVRRLVAAIRPLDAARVIDMQPSAGAGGELLYCKRPAVAHQRLPAAATSQVVPLYVSSTHCPAASDFSDAPTMTLNAPVAAAARIP